MQSTSSVSPWHVCYFPSLNHFHSYHLCLLSKRIKISTLSPLKNQNHFTTNSSLSLTTTNGCSKEREKTESTSYPYQNHAFLEEFCSSIDRNNTTRKTKKTQNNEGEEKTECDNTNSAVISTNMWWADWKAAFGQRINLEGIVCSVRVFGGDRHCVIPHVAVPDIRYIDWAELKRRGFQGVVFDKDNTLTVPYSFTLWNPLNSSLKHCKSVFGDDIAVFSNSAGLHEYDPDGRKARALESAIGIKVIRHRVKKPAGTAEEIEKQFGCESFKLIMVGDRPFTDIVYGNRNSFLTILTEPLSLAEEPFIVKQVRKLELALVNRWSRKGVKPTSHRLLPDVLQCVKDPPPLQIRNFGESQRW